MVFLNAVTEAVCKYDTTRRKPMARISSGPSKGKSFNENLR